MDLEDFMREGSLGLMMLIIAPFYLVALPFLAVGWLVFRVVDRLGRIE